jgi:hypothetical protein
MATQSVTARWRTAFVALSVFLAVSLVAVRPARTVLHANDFVQLLVSPTLSERGDMLVQVLVTRDAENQWMKVTAESEAYYSSSEMELEGEYSARVKVIRFRDVPAGWYEVTGTVFDHHKKVKGQSRRSVLVFPR